MPSVFDCRLGEEAAKIGEAIRGRYNDSRDELLDLLYRSSISYGTLPEDHPKFFIKVMEAIRGASASELTTFFGFLEMQAGGWAVFNAAAECFREESVQIVATPFTRDPPPGGDTDRTDIAEASYEKNAAARRLEVELSPLQKLIQDALSAPPAETRVEAKLLVSYRREV